MKHESVIQWSQQLAIYYVELPSYLEKNTIIVGVHLKYFFINWMYLTLS